MLGKNLLYLFFIITLFLPRVHYAGDKEKMAVIYKLFSHGEYDRVLLALDKIEKKSGLTAYWRGLCHKKLQQYEKSIKSFSRALKQKYAPKDIYYELGQSLYAVNELEKARKAFRYSLKKRFQITSSLYYIAHISQILNEWKKSHFFYRKLTEAPNIDKHLLQVSKFQMAEVELSKWEKRPNVRVLVKEKILPQMDRAVFVNPQSSLSTEIRMRIREIKNRYKLNPHVMGNGRKLPERRWSNYVRQYIGYDTNVTNEADNPSVSATDSSSILSTTSLYTSYLANWGKYFTIQPELRFEYDYYLNRDEPTVYQNDSYLFSGGLNMTYEHVYNGKPASINLDFNYNYTARDWEQQEELKHYAHISSYSLGESLHIFDMGKSTFSLKYKLFYGYQESIDTTSYILSYMQEGNISLDKTLLFYFHFEDLKGQETTDDTRTYLFNGNYFHAQIIEDWILGMGLTLIFLDPLGEKETRGLEKTITPKLTLIHKYSPSMKIKATYSYTKNISKDKENYDYSKHVMGLEFEYRF